MATWHDELHQLFPPAAFRAEFNAAMQPVLDGAIERVNVGSVVPTLDIESFRDDLQKFDFDAPWRLDDVVQWTIRQLESGLVHINHPRYFGLFNPNPNFPAQCADRITSAFNPQLATWTSSPAAVEIENHVIAAVAARAGLPSTSRGHFTTGGSEANYTALLLALTRACPDFALEGARAFSGQPVFYVSRESHLAWLKIAHQAGIGRNAVRLVPTDGTGRMDVTKLAAMIEADRENGCFPAMIAATAGTTIAGMIDPLHACSTLAAEQQIWFHVDAAWGGAVIASPRLKHLMTGIELADSVTIDAHKWWATTMGCGIFITRDAAVLSSTFCASTSFMPSNIQTLDPYVTSVQWSRRFLGLRLFLALATVGWDGYAAHVEQMLSLGEMLKTKLAAADWRILNDSALGVICFLPPVDQSLKPVVAQVLASGNAWVSVTVFEGQEVIRACVTNGQTNADDIQLLVACLQTCSN